MGKHSATWSDAYFFSGIVALAKTDCLSHTNGRGFNHGFDVLNGFHRLKGLLRV